VVGASKQGNDTRCAYSHPNLNSSNVHDNALGEAAHAHVLSRAPAYYPSCFLIAYRSQPRCHVPHLKPVLTVLTGMENQPRTRCRLSKHQKTNLRRRWFRRVGRAIPHQRPCRLRPSLPCTLHAEHAHSPFKGRARAFQTGLYHL